jgi:uncharacterized protein (TIGR01777 family)
MKIAITGTSGLIGSELVPSLRANGHTVVRLVRRPVTADDESTWNPALGEVDDELLATCDAIIHLAGENVASGRWTERRRHAIPSSRVQGLRTLTDALGHCRQRPTVLVSASATGYYGDRGDELLDEHSTAGDGFLAGVCCEWEAGLKPVAAMGVRTVAVRIGLVLSCKGGALAKMSPVFRLGLGGRLGHGRQWMSWIAMDDLLQVFHRVLTHDTMCGPINAVAPHPVRNLEFTRILAGVLKRPAVLPVPAVVMRLVFGRMADEALLASVRAEPRRLRESGFIHQFPDLQPALHRMLTVEERS